MHATSMAYMKQFVEYMARTIGDRKTVVDIGSMDTGNGCYKKLFTEYNYVGYDIAAGNNVDVVGTDLYKFPFPDNSFDVVISGQTLEHVEDMHRFIKEIARIVQPDSGLICIIAPHTYDEHRFPIDCWRIFPDGMRFLIEDVAGLEIIAVGKGIFDTVGIGRKKS